MFGEIGNLFNIILIIVSYGCSKFVEYEKNVE